MNGILPGKPLSAKFQIEMPISLRETSVWLSAIYRAADGSTRQELTRGDDVYFDLILQAGGQQLIVFPADKTTYLTHFSLEGSMPMWGYLAKPTPTIDTREILGFTCKKTLLTGQSRGEIWADMGLGLPMLDTEDLPEGRVVWSAISVTTDAPDSALFKAPEDTHEVSIGN